MSTTIVLKSFQELGTALNLAALPPGPADATMPAPLSVADPSASPLEGDSLDGGSTPILDLPSLLSQLAAAAETLASAQRADEVARHQAELDLGRYEALVAELHDAEQALTRAQQVRTSAEALLAGAFDERTRAAADQVLALVARSETAATRLLSERGQLVAALEAQPTVQRVLDERREQAERAAEERRATAEAAAQRLAVGLARASEALGQGRVEEAETMLGHLAKDHPDSAEITSLLHTIAHERWLVKAQAAEQTLHTARKLHRRDPRGALALLEALEVIGLPEALGRQLFGLWAGCHALLQKHGALIEPLRYAPDPGRGLIFARERPAGSYVVSGALGMGPAWLVGSAVPERLLRRARPLR